jgi:hypothetical protein
MELVGLARGKGGEVCAQEDSLDVSSFGGCTTQSSNELVGFISSDLTRGARSAWRRARNSPCDALGGAEVGL